MTPIELFEQAWHRCDHLSALHAYLAVNVTAALSPSEILRAEWAARVSALDLYVHELLAQRANEIFAGARDAPNGFSKLQIDANSVVQMRADTASFLNKIDLEVRSKIERRTFQAPDDVAEAIRCVSSVELWNEIALYDGATEKSKKEHAKTIKIQLTQIVNRRNKIVHEVDLQPAIPRIPWPISINDLAIVRAFIEKIVRAINAVT